MRDSQWEGPLLNATGSRHLGRSRAAGDPARGPLGTCEVVAKRAVSVAGKRVDLSLFRSQRRFLDKPPPAPFQDIRAAPLSTTKRRMVRLTGGDSGRNARLGPLQSVCGPPEATWSSTRVEAWAAIGVLRSRRDPISWPSQRVVSAPSH